MATGFNARFNIPSNLLAVGPTSCGKTSWLKKLVKNKDIMFSPVPKCMLLFYKESQHAYDVMEQKMNKNREGKSFTNFHLCLNQ